MRQFELIVLILSFYCLRSTETSDCGVSTRTECPNNTRLDNLECLMNQHVTSIKDLLQLFKESQIYIADIKHEMKINFLHQEWALNRLLGRDNTSIVKISSRSSNACPAPSASNGSGILVNPSTIARVTVPIKSCSDLNFTDQALLQPSKQFLPFWVLCVQRHKTTGNGWVVIQQRVRGKTDFFRPWIEYREGFGNLDSEYWLGLESIHQLTALHQNELLVEMTDFSGNYKYARYSRFEIAGEDEGYALRQLGSYSGTAGDGLGLHVGMKFSTYDNDNDHNENFNCAMSYSSGWWFDKCFINGANLNGLWSNSNSQQSIVWFKFNTKLRSLKFVRMMLRVVQ